MIISGQNNLTSYIVGANPPVTVTGIAPWAIKPAANNPNVPDSHSSVADPINTTRTPNELIQEFISKCIPSEDEMNEKVVDWKHQQAAITPTLLPNLKFHDLVFGKDLGKGAFSTVRYARMIIREKSRSLWPEYAVKVRLFARELYKLTCVKIISEDCLQEHNYQRAVIREMTILQV